MTSDTAGALAPDPRSVEPPEIARLFNPAYCAAVLAQCAHAYAAVRAGGMPLLLAYLCLPLASHGETRRAVLARNRAYSVHRLVRDRPDLLAGLADRVGAFRPITSQAILFGSAHGLLRYDASASSITAAPEVTRRLTSAVLGDEIMEAVRTATRLGTWFAAQGPAEVFLYFGLRP